MPPTRAPCDDGHALAPYKYCVAAGATADADRRSLAIRLTISFDQAERRSARFSPVSDVLPFPGLLLFTRPGSPLGRSQNNNSSSRQAA